MAKGKRRGPGCAVIIVVVIVLFIIGQCSGKKSESTTSATPVSTTTDGGPTQPSQTTDSQQSTDSSNDAGTHDSASDSHSDDATAWSSESSSASQGAASKEGNDSSNAAGQGAGKGSGRLYKVMSIVDGDTIKVNIDGEKTTVRLIGLDTPETKKPHTAVQCYGKEASSHMQSLVQSRDVQLEADPTQDERDRYGRLLRYVYVGGSTNVALDMLANGYGREYTYNAPYKYQSQFRAAEAAARAAGKGTWGSPCNGFHTDDGAISASSSEPAAAPSVASQAPSQQPQAPAQQSQAPQAPANGGCYIKGNINSKGKKIAHAPGGASYDKTKIDTSKGERCFSSAEEAIAAGWRMARD